MTAYTAVIQLGAIAATLIYFFRDIVRLAAAWFRGLPEDQRRARDPDYGLAWAVVDRLDPRWVSSGSSFGSHRGPAAQPLGGRRCPRAVERRHGGRRAERGSGVRAAGARSRGKHRDPGRRPRHRLGPVLLAHPGRLPLRCDDLRRPARGIDRVTATRLSFFLAIPALTAAGVFQAVEPRGPVDLGSGSAMVVGVIVAFVVAYASIAWLLRFVASNSLMPFVWYRVALGVLAGRLRLAAGWITAT